MNHVKKWIGVPAAILFFALLLLTGQSSLKVRAASWEINTKTATASMPSAAKKAYNKALKKFTGSKVTPIAYLGSQVVSGTNYEFLCLTKKTTKSSSCKLQLLKINKDLDGKCTIVGFSSFKLSDYAVNAELPVGEEEAGGWTIYTKAKKASLSAKLKTYFQSATKTLAGASYTPIAYLGKKTGSSGTTYALLCKGKTITETSSSYTHLYVMTIKTTSKKKAEIKYICALDPSTF